MNTNEILNDFNFEQIQLNIKNVPNYLKLGKLYLTFIDNKNIYDDDDDENIIPTSKKYLKPDSTINNELDLFWYLHSIRYWMVDEITIDYIYIFDFVSKTENIDSDAIKSIFFDLKIANEINYWHKINFPDLNIIFPEITMKYKPLEKKYLQIIKNINNTTLGKSNDEIINIWKTELLILECVYKNLFLKIHKYLYKESSCPKIMINYLEEYYFKAKCYGNKKKVFLNLFIVKIIQNKYDNLYKYLIHNYSPIFLAFSYSSTDAKKIIIKEIIRNKCNDIYKYTIQNVFHIEDADFNQLRVLCKCIKYDNVKLFLDICKEINFEKEHLKYTIKYSYRKSKLNFFDEKRIVNEISNLNNLKNDVEKKLKECYDENDYALETDSDTDTNLYFDSDLNSDFDSSSDSEIDNYEHSDYVFF